MAGMNLATVEILRASGSRELHEVGKHILLPWIKRMISAEVTDSFSLKDGTGRVCIVDDLGHGKQLPVNTRATELYWAICRPGTIHQIRGDVAIARDEDFA